MSESEHPDAAAPLTGPALARAALEAAQAKSAAARTTARHRRPSYGTANDRRPRGYSGAGPDPRDPQLLGSLIEKLVKTRGWQQPTAEGTVFGAWEKVVGAEVAAHSRPIKLENTELTVEAESTAWATQLRLLAPKLVAGIATQVGHNVVTKLHIHGPTAPSWAKGPRRVKGRGPRDTYG